MQALQHKLALEANRVGELEGLLSGMRTNQFKSTFSEQHSADKAGSLQARNTLLTQQASLMHAIHSFVQHWYLYIMATCLDVLNKQCGLVSRMDQWHQLWVVCQSVAIMYGGLLCSGTQLQLTNATNCCCCGTAAS